MTVLAPNRQAGGWVSGGSCPMIVYSIMGHLFHHLLCITVSINLCRNASSFIASPSLGVQWKRKLIHT